MQKKELKRKKTKTKKNKSLKDGIKKRLPK